MPVRILIVGGTSGIGLALALYYLKRGEEVAICGRALRRVPEALPGKFPQLRCYELDVADKPALAHAMNDFAERGLDLLILTAGVYFNTRRHYLDANGTVRMLQTNVSGLAHAFELAAQKMLVQQSGQLVAISSVAGLLNDYPGASLYSATKRSVLSLCETYRIALKPFSIAVTAIVPGYIDTVKLRELNAGDASRKPFLRSEAQAVDRIVDAIARRKAILIFPWQMRWLIVLLNLLPRRLIALLR